MHLRTKVMKTNFTICCEIYENIEKLWRYTEHFAREKRIVLDKETFFLKILNYDFIPFTQKEPIQGWSKVYYPLQLLQPLTTTPTALYQLTLRRVTLKILKRDRSLSFAAYFVTGCFARLMVKLYGGKLWHRYRLF